MWLNKLAGWDDFFVFLHEKTLIGGQINRNFVVAIIKLVILFFVADSNSCMPLQQLKGQLISKGNFSVNSILHKNKLKNVIFCPSLLGQKIFVRFLWEFEKNKKPFWNSLTFSESVPCTSFTNLSNYASPKYVT